jgi:hypothetical protein
MTNTTKSPICITGRSASEQLGVSRRNFFQQAVRGAAVVGAGAFSGMAMSGPVQAQYGGGPWKSTAYYRDAPNGPQFCGRCVHFRPPAACQIVEPPISPGGWCRYFYPTTRRRVPGTSAYRIRLLDSSGTVRRRTLWL